MSVFSKFNISTWSLMLAAMVVSSAALARHQQDPEFDRAQVVSVNPIIEYVDEPIEREVCWNEPVTYREPSRRRSNTGAIFGAILGGVIGNQFGGGHGRTATTAAGAALGYSIGRDQQRRVRDGRTYERDQEVCRIETDYQRQERVSGYDVAYRYHGRVYHTQTDYHPGDTIRVEVQVVAVP